MALGRTSLEPPHRAILIGHVGPFVPGSTGAGWVCGCMSPQVVFPLTDEGLRPHRPLSHQCTHLERGSCGSHPSYGSLNQTLHTPRTQLSRVRRPSDVPPFTTEQLTQYRLLEFEILRQLIKEKQLRRDHNLPPSSQRTTAAPRGVAMEGACDCSGVQPS